MIRIRRAAITRLEILAVLAIIAVSILLVVGVYGLYADRFLGSPGERTRSTLRSRTLPTASKQPARPIPKQGGQLRFLPRINCDTSGFQFLTPGIEGWEPTASLLEISLRFKDAAHKMIAKVENIAESAGNDKRVVVAALMNVALLHNSEGEALQSYAVLENARAIAEDDEQVATAFLHTIIYLQGVTALRGGENANCIMCRGESSCILPISSAAVHTNPAGSRLAIGHFTEYLEKFPDDLEVRWLLNLAHMTLGEHPDKVDPRYLVSLDRFVHSEFDIGRFRDIGQAAGVNRFNQAGGAIMDDFDNDGMLDIVTTTFDCTGSMAYYRNTGRGNFADETKAAGVTEQLGGLVCYQADFDNDGRMDIFVPRGAWIPWAVRPSLLRNDGSGRFKEVTESAGNLAPLNSNAASWADYDNDGWIDLFVGCERQTNRLYHNKGDGTFEEVAAKAGVKGDAKRFCKGCAWIDFDNDRFPDLFINNLQGAAELHRNNRDGTFTDVTREMGIDGPQHGFSCWAFDYDNDGWVDIFATCYDRTLADVVRGLLNQKHGGYSNRLYHNRNGRSFEDVTEEAGLDMVFATMGSNYADFDNDGFLDMYLGTGEPSFATLIPNRMLKNVAGRRFAEITGTSGTGHLQKGHGVACGDWDRDGDIDIFIETGGAVNGDKYHNVLFQNPGQGNHWLTVKLAGKKTNRAAIGARIKVVTAGDKPSTIIRHVSSGSSFGANPLQQTIGLEKAERVALLEVYWPTSDTTQVFHDIAADQAIEITEFASVYKPLNWTPIPQPE
jgi:FG-GAP-like repeat/ASPIC and UnbV